MIRGLCLVLLVFGSGLAYSYDDNYDSCDEALDRAMDACEITDEWGVDGDQDGARYDRACVESQMEGYSELRFGNYDVPYCFQDNDKQD